MSPLQRDNGVLLLLYQGICGVVMLRSVEGGKARALLDTVLGTSPSGGGRCFSVFAEVVGESICVCGDCMRIHLCRRAAF